MYHNMLFTHHNPQKSVYISIFRLLPVFSFKNSSVRNVYLYIFVYNRFQKKNKIAELKINTFKI